MDNYITLVYIVKVMICLFAFLIVHQFLKIFMIKKINISSEAKLLKYIFNNYTILEFDESIVIFTSTKNKIDITNDIYHITISYDEILRTFNYIVDDIYFNSLTKEAKLTIEEYNNIKLVIDNLGLTKFKADI